MYRGAALHTARASVVGGVSGGRPWEINILRTTCESCGCREAAASDIEDNNFTFLLLVRSTIIFHLLKLCSTCTLKSIEPFRDFFQVV